MSWLMPPDISSGNIPEGQVHFPPSDTNGYPTRVRLHGHGAGGVVAQRDAELAVELGLVLGVGSGEHADDVPQ